MSEEPKKAKYEVPKGEEHLVHARLIKKEFNKDTGEPLFAPFNQKYTIGEYENFLKYPHGFSVEEVLHDPRPAAKAKKSEGKE